MSHDWFLLFDRYPVEKIHRSGFGIVVTGNFFAKQRHQKRFEVEVAGKQAELFQYEFRAAETLRVFVVEVLGQVGNDFVAAGQLAFDFPLDGKARLLAVKIQNLVYRVEEFLSLAWGDFDFFFFLWRLLLWGAGWA